MKIVVRIVVVLIIFAFISMRTLSDTQKNQENKSIQCTENGCEGTYIGPEFINGSDVAHQFSNSMSAQVGDQLKMLYAQEIFSKVNMAKIEMFTIGMGTSQVEFYLKIPFSQVSSACEAYTSFDHVGGWNHKPSLSKRKKELSNALIPGETLDISNLKTTPEGLQEYWIQWKNKKVQAACK